MTDALAMLLAKSQIQDVALAYAQAVDGLDAGAFTQLFTDDAVMDGPGWQFNGPAEIALIIEMLRKDYEKTWHAVHNHAITISEDGQSATGQVYCNARHIVRGATPAQAVLTMIIRYDDSYMLHSGAWRIAHRRLHLDWTEISALSAT